MCIVCRFVADLLLLTWTDSEDMKKLAGSHLSHLANLRRASFSGLQIAYILISETEQ